jgi:hypothetical protein
MISIIGESGLKFRGFQVGSKGSLMEVWQSEVGFLRLELKEEIFMRLAPDVKRVWMS